LKQQLHAAAAAGGALLRAATYNNEEANVARTQPNNDGI
jgi:hypothetical protein